MSAEQDYFLKNVIIIFSPQEKQGKNSHITQKLDLWKVKYRKLYAPYHLKEGDYSFVIDGVDYRSLFLIERKYGLQELDMCISQENKMTKAKKQLTDKELRDNLEYEFARMKSNQVIEKWLFIENCGSFEQIKDYKSGYEKKKYTAGMRIYSTLSSWACNNRYGIKVECLPDKNQFANIMLNKMDYFWRNQMKIKYGDNFIKKLKNI